MGKTRLALCVVVVAAICAGLVVTLIVLRQVKDATGVRLTLPYGWYLRYRDLGDVRNVYGKDSISSLYNGPERMQLTMIVVPGTWSFSADQSLWQASTTLQIGGELAIAGFLKADPALPFNPVVEVRTVHEDRTYIFRFTTKSQSSLLTSIAATSRLHGSVLDILSSITFPN